MKAVLDPIDRVSEVIFGVLMAMTFIGAVNVAEAGNGEVRKVLIAALGCNIAWGLTDGIMYLVAMLTERSRARMLGEATQDAPRLHADDFRGAFQVFVLVTVSTVGLLFGGFYVLLATPIAAVLATLLDVVVLDKDPGEQEVPALIFPAKDAETG